MVISQNRSWAPSIKTFLAKALTHVFNKLFFRLFLEASPIHQEFMRDLDIIKKNMFRIETEDTVHPPPSPECTLHEEILPPTERPSVQNMIAMGRRVPRTSKLYQNSKTGLDYWPFHR